MMRKIAFALALLASTSAFAGNGSTITPDSLIVGGTNNPGCDQFTMTDTGSTVYYGISINDPWYLAAYVMVQDFMHNGVSLFFNTGGTLPSGNHASDCSTGVTYIYKLRGTP